jgi:hypothetical protein
MSKGLIKAFRPVWICSLALLCVLPAAAQDRTGFIAGFGVMRYNGDVGKLKNRIISPAKVLRLYGKIGLSYRLGGHVEASLNYMHGSVEDADSLSDNSDQILRNQSFQSPIDEVSLQFDFYMFHLLAGRKLNPYLTAGAGTFWFNPQGFLDDNWFDLQPLGTEGQNLGQAIYNDPYKLREYSFLAGGGVSFQLATSWRLRLETAYHLTTTDYLDDVSTIYPDLNLLAAQPFGSLAVELSNRRLEPFAPEAGRSRGNPDSKDSFLHIGLSVIFNPSGWIKGSGRAGYHKRKSGRRLPKGQRCPVFDS